ncbi:hypothetical protein cypCar_00004246, partial [Cyprinus carpio]
LRVHAMSGHGHGHGGGHSHGCCECDHEPAERGVEYELYRRIDIEKLQCLNESRDGDGKLVFKPWDQRTDRTKSSGMFLSLFQAHRHEITICNYEAAANPADHKVETITPQTQFIS